MPHKTFMQSLCFSRPNKKARLASQQRTQGSKNRNHWLCILLSIAMGSICSIGVAATTANANPTLGSAANTTSNPSVNANVNASLVNSSQTSPSITRPQLATAPTIIPQPPYVNAKAYVLMDAASGKIIAQKNMNKRRPPASLTKMMTLYVVSSALRNGQINLDDKVIISKKAWAMGGSKMFIKEGARVSVHELIQGVIVDSGNDACVALAQYVAGNEKTFAMLMNKTAKALGMTSTHFTDSTGLPHPDHYTTAHDLSILARALVLNFPDDYTWYKQKWFTHNNIRQSNRNLLLWRDPTVDGIKTGHTQAAGYCLVASAKRNNMRLITVVMGTSSMNARSNVSQTLLNYGFRFYRSKQYYRAGQAIAQARIWYGAEKYIPIGPVYDVYTVLPFNEDAQTKVVIHVDKNLAAPIETGVVCGEADLIEGNNIIQRIPLVALQGTGRTGFFGRLTDGIAYKLSHLWS